MGAAPSQEHHRRGAAPLLGACARRGPTSSAPSMDVNARPRVAFPRPRTTDPFMDNLLPEVLAVICKYCGAEEFIHWRAATRATRDLPVDWMQVAMSTVLGGPGLKAVLADMLVQANGTAPTALQQRCLRLASVISRRDFLDVGGHICSLAPKSAQVPRHAAGWRRDASYGSGLQAFGVVGRLGELLVQQNTGQGALWSTDLVDLREPLELAMEVRIHNGNGGVHIALSGNCRAWSGPNSSCDALSVAVLKRHSWPQRCDCIWVRSGMFNDQVACNHFPFGTWPMRTWGRVVLRVREGDLEVEAFGQSARLPGIVEVQPRTVRTVTGLPPLVHIGLLGWNYDSRADIRHLSLKVGDAVHSAADP